MTNVRKRLLLATFAMFASVPASAQEYYMRKMLLKPPAAATYQPTFGPYSSCYNGKQTAAIASCTRSDGVTVANSYCSKQSDTKDCATTCYALTARTWIGAGGSTWTSGTAASAAAAQQFCNSKKPAGFVGSCFWDSRNGQVVLSTSSTVFFNNTDLFGGTCG